MKTARIRKAKKKGALWLLIDEEGKNAEDLNDYILEAPEGGTAYAIMEDEVEAIRNACEEYLEIESQESMKGNINV